MKRCSRLVLSIMAFACCVWAQTPEPEEFKLVLLRFPAGPRAMGSTSVNYACTSGMLTIFNKFGVQVGTVDTLEPKWANNQQYISSIPRGKYSAHLIYYHLDQWRIELNNVPGGRTHIQIHIGNVPSQTEGCILVGKRKPAPWNDPQSGCELIDSAKAYRLLKKAFYGLEDPTFTPNVKITLIIN